MTSTINPFYARGESDPRHLWPEMRRLVRELRSHWVFARILPATFELGLDAVLDDLEAAGNTATPFVPPACAVRVPHRRDRVGLLPTPLASDWRQAQSMPRSSLRNYHMDRFGGIGPHASLLER